MGAKLKVVAISDDGTELLLARRANAKSGEYAIRVDETLIETIKAATRRALEIEEKRAADRAKTNVIQAPPEPEPRTVSKLTPKEIQALLRRGVTPASIARRAGVDVSWVERFQGPILWERAGMASRAQKATFHKARGGPSGAPLIESISACLGGRGVDAAAIEAGTWDAVRRPKKNAWAVSFSYLHRGREQRATWDYDPATDEIVAMNRLAADIGWVPQPRRKRAG